MNKTETWRNIPEWLGLYQASDHGRVRSLPRQVFGTDSIGREWSRRYPGKVLNQHDLGLGYVTVCLSKDGGCRNHYVHRLVCSAFHGPCPADKRDAAHGNNVRGDNRPENLRWATSKENQQEKIAHGTVATREGHGMAKVNSAIVGAIREARQAGATITELSDRFNISRSQVHRIVTGEHWRSLG